MGQISSVEAILLGVVALGVGVGGWQILHKEPAAVSAASCQTVSIDEQMGSMQISCSNQRSGLNLTTNADMALALSQAMHPRPMMCTLYQKRRADCHPSPMDGQ